LKEPTRKTTTTAVNPQAVVKREKTREANKPAAAGEQPAPAAAAAAPVAAPAGTT
jgi:hypothetical protein